MNLASGHPAPAADHAALRRVTDLLGGVRVLRQNPQNPLAAHELLLRGLPGEALQHLLGSLTVLRRAASLEKAVGMSLRTFQRHKDAPARPLNAEQSGRTWKFAEVLAQAIAVFGTQDEAEQWLERPALGLDGRRPIDLLATPAGVELVEDYLGRMETGTYT